MDNKTTSLEYLSLNIERLRYILNDLTTNNTSNEFENEIVKISQVLDEFIVKYMILKNKGKY